MKQKWTTASWTQDIVSPSTLPVSGFGFESPYVGQGYLYSPSGGSWTFAGGSGVTGNSSAFTSGNPAAPEGGQVAFLQTGSGSVISQSIAGFQAGTPYTLTFAAAQRGNCCGYGGQDFDVYLDDRLLGTFRPASASYADLSLSFHGYCGSAHTEVRGP